MENNSNKENEAVTQVEETNRKWKKQMCEETVVEYNIPEGPVEAEFIGCQSAVDVFLRLIGDRLLDHIVFQSNLYATQRGKTLNLSKEELLAFIGINFFMAYHRLPAWKHYWNTSKDLGTPIAN
ncbi:hypothetical protein NQ315_000352 [Exocentrus adspersus]|uniref:PiggyBac transposable element-derived protein domain-containing protein n=1 Tax=Exocentrus adspersus TaxID=1586481 RepID=A0AAV8VM25_9CUCU|nr:hypothetical protein NQ315_000352 [Exocentrus adspersus]